MAEDEIDFDDLEIEDRDEVPELNPVKRLDDRNSNLQLKFNIKIHSLKVILCTFFELCFYLTKATIQAL